MELRHLRYFVAIADSGTMARASERVFVTQSTLSHQLAQLEKEVGDALFAGADVFAFPSVFEGLGLSLIEAQACGLACVASRTGGIVDVVEEGKTGLLVAVDDLGAMGEAMVRLGSDRALSRDMGQQGAELVRRRFSRSVFRERVMVLLGINSAVSA